MDWCRYDTDNSGTMCLDEAVHFIEKLVRTTLLLNHAANVTAVPDRNPDVSFNCSVIATSRRAWTLHTNTYKASGACTMKIRVVALI